MVKLVDGVCEQNVSRIRFGWNRPDALRPEDVNVLQLNLGSLVMENGEVDIEPPQCELCSPLLAIRGKDDVTIQKSQAIVGSAEVGLGSLFA
jgi:hypothetical protein